MLSPKLVSSQWSPMVLKHNVSSGAAGGPAAQTIIDRHVTVPIKCHCLPGELRATRAPLNEAPHLLDYQQNVFAKNASQKHQRDMAICFANNLFNCVIYR